jgi:hypothetical protein
MRKQPTDLSKLCLASYEDTAPRQMTIEEKYAIIKAEFGPHDMNHCLAMALALNHAEITYGRE